MAAGGPAEKGGVKRGDIIISYDGKEVKKASDLPMMVAETPVGKEVGITVLRNGKEVPVTVKVEEMTAARVATQTQGSGRSFGMRVDNLTPLLRQQFGISDKSGAVVVGVDQGSVAEEAGIQPGDVIKEVNHRPVRNLQDFSSAAAAVPEGQPLLILLKRGRQTFYVTLELSQ